MPVEDLARCGVRLGRWSVRFFLAVCVVYLRSNLFNVFVVCVCSSDLARYRESGSIFAKCLEALHCEDCNKNTSTVFISLVCSFWNASLLTF